MKAWDWSQCYRKLALRCTLTIPALKMYRHEDQEFKAIFNYKEYFEAQNSYLNVCWWNCSVLWFLRGEGPGAFSVLFTDQMAPGTFSPLLPCHARLIAGLSLSFNRRDSLSTVIYFFLFCKLFTPSTVTGVKLENCLETVSFTLFCF